MPKLNKHSLFTQDIDSISFSIDSLSETERFFLQKEGEKENAIGIRFLTDKEDFTLFLNENQFVELYEKIDSFVKFMNKFN